MSEVTRLLGAAAAGDPAAAAELLPLVYDELRRLAAARMRAERADHTLEPTALVHEAYLRLVGGGGGDREWAGRGHFFAAAAEAMRRILVDSARRRRAEKRGGDRERVGMPADLPAGRSDPEVLAVHEVLDQFAEVDPESAELVKLHFFAGLTIEQAAAAIGTSARTAYRNWDFARAWMYRRLRGDDPA